MIRHGLLSPAFLYHCICGFLVVLTKHLTNALKGLFWLSLRAQHTPAGKAWQQHMRCLVTLQFNQGTGCTLALFSLVQKLKPMRESPYSGWVFPQAEICVYVTPNPTGLATVTNHTILKPEHIQVSSGRFTSTQEVQRALHGKMAALETLQSSQQPARCFGEALHRPSVQFPSLYRSRIAQASRVDPK